MIDRRTKNAEIFRDTERRYTSDPMLIQAVQKSTEAQVFIAEHESVIVPSPHKAEKAKVIVSGKRSLEAAENYAKQGKKVCVLNFASATNPGGGVVNGSSAQEECLCRCTTLYPCLNNNALWTAFYAPHRKAADPLYNNDCIYTPNICVFKSDINFPEPLPKADWWNVNILTCAAPNLRERPSNAMNPRAGDKAAKITPTELEKLLTARIRRIFEIAVANGNAPGVLDPDNVLGAFTIDDEITDYICSQPVKSINIASGVSSADVYFVADAGYTGFSINGTAVTTLGDDIVTDAVTLFHAVLSSGDVTLSRMTP